MFALNLNIYAKTLHIRTFSYATDFDYVALGKESDLCTVDHCWLPNTEQQLDPFGRYNRYRGNTFRVSFPSPPTLSFPEEATYTRLFFAGIGSTNQ
jgi:hypothetical protein